MAREREGRQPRFAADDPAFIRRNEAIGPIERAEIHFDLVAAAPKRRRAAARAEMPSFIGARFSRDRHRIGGKDRRGGEERGMTLAENAALAKAPTEERRGGEEGGQTG